MDFDLICELYTLNIHIYMILSAHKKKKKSFFRSKVAWWTILMSFISLLQVQKLKDYVPFCANQVFGKAMLDEKKNDPAVDDFLQRCQDSPFSRKLDLWTLLGTVFPDIHLSRIFQRK